MQTQVRAPAQVGDHDDRGPYAGALIVLEATLAVAAFGGALALVASPRDAMPADLLDRTPFASWIWPGILLAVTVGVPALAVAIATVRRKTYAHGGHLAVGALLIGWILVQLLVIGPSSWLQPLMFVWGLAILILGWANYRTWSGGTTTEEGRR